MDSNHRPSGYLRLNAGYPWFPAKRRQMLYQLSYTPDYTPARLRHPDVLPRRLAGVKRLSVFVSICQRTKCGGRLWSRTTNARSYQPVGSALASNYRVLPSMSILIFLSRFFSKTSEPHGGLVNKAYVLFRCTYALRSTQNSNVIINNLSDMVSIHFQFFYFPRGNHVLDLVKRI